MDLFRRTDDGDPDGGAPVDTDTLSAIFLEIIQERIRQDAKWGGPEHDDEHNAYDWREFITERVRKAKSYDESPEGIADFRRRLVETAALAVAAIQSLDRKEARRDPAR